MFQFARKVLPYLRPYRGRFALALGQVFLITGLELLKPWPLQVVVDHVLGDKPPPEWLSIVPEGGLLLAACLTLVAVWALLGAVTLSANIVSIGIGHAMVNDLRRDLYSHLQRLSLAFHSRQKVGDLMYRVTADTFSVQSLLMNGLLPILQASVLLAGMFVIMMRMDAWLTLLALVVCPLLFVAISLLNRHIVSAATQVRERESAVYSLVQWTMSAMRVIQAFTKEDEERHRFMDASRQSLSANLRLYSLQTFYSALINVLIAVGTALVIFVGARAVMTGALTIGELLVFVSYLAALYGPINQITQTWGLIQGAKVGVQRVFEILDIEHDLKDGTRVLPPEGVHREIRWEGVTFDYLSGQPVLRDIALSVKVGQKIAIVGPTGAGKSTLVGMIPRFFDPNAGRVTIDGVDIREFRIRSLRQQVAMVLQPPLIFPISVRENIAYGRPDASDEEIVEAAKLASIHDRIMRFPAGYDTVVGEQGVSLSEGEKQRLTIARAILRDAPILILDEPTSALDAETEALIMDGINRLTEGRTAFIIAHRLSTVRDCDLVVVVRDGRIVEQGGFDELIARGGFFAKLYRTQFRQNGDSTAPAPEVAHME